MQAIMRDIAVRMTTGIRIKRERASLRATAAPVITLTATKGDFERWFESIGAVAKKVSRPRGGQSGRRVARIPELRYRFTRSKDLDQVFGKDWYLVYDRRSVLGIHPPIIFTFVTVTAVDRSCGLDDYSSTGYTEPKIMKESATSYVEVKYNYLVQMVDNGGVNTLKILVNATNSDPEDPAADDDEIHSGDSESHSSGDGSYDSGTDDSEED